VCPCGLPEIGGTTEWAQVHRATQARKSAKHENSHDFKPHCDVVSTVLDLYLTLLCLAPIKERSLAWQGGPLNHHF
jgi:hypothetical protein